MSLHACQSASCSPFAFRPEVDGVDVLVLLGRVLGVLDGAVGPVVEPGRVLLHPRVVGRALEGVIESDLHVVVAGGLDQVLEVVDGAQAGLDGGVAALGAADGPRTARVVGTGLERVVGPLAVADADGVDGREIEDVEAHGCHPGDAVVGGGPQAALGAGEELVPGGEHGPLAVDPQGDGVGRGDVDGVGGGGEDGGQIGVEGVDESAAVVGVDAEGVGRLLQGFPVGRGHVVGSALEQAGALLQLDGDVLARGLLDEDVAAPRAEAVGPRLDAHLVAAEGAGLDGRRPPVVAGVGHRRVPPLRLALRPVRDPGREQVVALAEDVGRDGRGMPDHRLGRIPPGRCARARVDDDNPTSHPTGVPPKAVAQPAAVRGAYESPTDGGAPKTLRWHGTAHRKPGPEVRWREMVAGRRVRAANDRWPSTTAMRGWRFKVLWREMVARRRGRAANDPPAARPPCGAGVQGSLARNGRQATWTRRERPLAEHDRLDLLDGEIVDAPNRPQLVERAQPAPDLR